MASKQLAAAMEWKAAAKNVMRHYAEATDGSYIEAKETGMVWRYEDADPRLAPLQAKELLDHLATVLASEPVAVRSGYKIVEVIPQVRNDHQTAMPVIFHPIRRARSSSITFLIRA